MILKTESIKLINAVSRCIKPIFKSVPDMYCNNILKQNCVSALKSSNPYELAYVIDKKTQIPVSKFVGNLHSCEIDLQGVSSPVYIIHSHPSVIGDISLPVSLQDYILMNNNPFIEKVVAYNIKGEESYLLKKPNFVSLSEKELENLKLRYSIFLINNLPVEVSKKVKSLINYSMNNKNCDVINQEIADRLNNIQHSEFAPEIIDKFWREFSPYCNVEYFSNFTK